MIELDKGWIPTVERWTTEEVDAFLADFNGNMRNRRQPWRLIVRACIGELYSLMYRHPQYSDSVVIVEASINAGGVIRERGLSCNDAHPRTICAALMPAMREIVNRAG